MTLAPESRSLLPMAGHVRGKRSAVTCHLKCGDACAQPVPNTSDNAYFRDVASAALTRRTVLGGLGAGALALVVGPTLGAQPAAAHGKGHGATKGLAFGPIAPVPATTDALTVPDGYRWQPVIRWGDPILRHAPAFDRDAQTAQAQAGQFGYNNDYVDIVPMLPTGRDRSRGDKGALLVVNHEYTNENLMFPPSSEPAVLAERKRIAMNAHGMSVVELRRSRAGKPWEYLRIGNYNRRITASTPFALTGPAAGSELLRTVEDPEGRTVLGTLNNCAGGTTPWGTVLSGEENVNQYFRTAGTSPRDTRYGLADKATTRGWEEIEPRFDARNPGYENEPHRFGWIVEVDPHDPESVPVKHTALGRFKHEGANVILAPSGQVVAYMGDDERFDYLYKFVSRDAMRTGSKRADREHNKTLLSAGSLYVARFAGDSPAAEITGTGALPADGEFDGTGEWIPLVVDGVSHVPGFTTEEVLVFTRLAADTVGATKMDRPEDVEPNPHTGRVYVACTNNTDRGKAGKEGATEPNPRVANRDGHVVEITEDGDDPTASTFRWTLLLVCGDPAAGTATYFAGFPAEQVSPISCPDNLAFDAAGNLWVSTDGQPGTIGYCDGLFKVPLEGAERGHVQQFLAVPAGAETCGPVIRSDESMVFVAVQHPGEDGSFEVPQSSFPDYVAPGRRPRRGEARGPRPSVVQVWRG